MLLSLSLSLSSCLKVGPLTTKYKTQCFCNHLTSFGSDAAVAPNTIDFSNVWAKFGNLSENAAVFSTVISLLGIYVILLIWLRYMDKQDIIKVTFTFQSELLAFLQLDHLTFFY